MTNTGFSAETVAQVQSLNQAFIGELYAAAQAQRVAVEPTLITALSTARHERHSSLRQCPFLLFRIEIGHCGVNEPSGVWLGAHHDSTATLICAALTFIWQLAKTDIAAARLVSGAPISWIEDLAQRQLAELVGFAKASHLRPRLIDVPGYWHDLLRRSGISALQRASLGAAGLQMCLSRSRLNRQPRNLPTLSRALPDQ
ncbi:MAG: hypothetical protein AAGA84_00035 [Pseudomonadota bacterium]